MHFDSTNTSELSNDLHVDGTSDILGDLQNHVLEKKRSSLETKNVSVVTSDLVVVASSYSSEDGDGLLPELQELSLVEALEASTVDACLVPKETTSSALDISILSYVLRTFFVMFEFVLHSLKKEGYPYWRPHFAINSLEAVSVVCLGNLSNGDFFDFGVKSVVLLR
ncbi:hypothetical protein AXF42_Ash020843 [Apostasia shenzhenica]|uniref:Uncharacterized protein n=1 Tax=Apostasia shenzhenica TaxID=1088818 RepID=A0A2I0A3E5_9ASPA|nr:hypothetical protein AXF42_Ash020843 [Apostasia shenzhenica]